MLDIISGFTNVEDYQSWLLENNPSVKDMTVAQTEQYLEGTKEEFAGYAQYVSLTTEEIVRFKSHVKQLLKTLELEEPIGKKLDFIVQEMNREVNTIGSKANNLDITNSVIELKNEIEKIREQIQNIE